MTTVTANISPSRGNIVQSRKRASCAGRSLTTPSVIHSVTQKNVFLMDSTVAAMLDSATPTMIISAGHITMMENAIRDVTLLSVTGMVMTVRGKKTRDLH